VQTKRISETFSASGQVAPRDVPALAAAGFRAILCNRPDGETAGQPAFAEVAAAAAIAGIEARHQPVGTGDVTDGDVADFEAIIRELPAPVLGYCRSGSRSSTLWALAERGRGRALPETTASASAAGPDLGGVARRAANGGRGLAGEPDAHHAVVIVGGGAAGIAVASSLKSRRPDLDVAIVEPADVHYYQPGWTMVGAGVFEASSTARTMASLIPEGVTWIKAGVSAFEPEGKAVILEGDRAVGYDRLIVAPGIELDWGAIEGLPETLGRNGVTSNYRFDLAPYTWRLVRELRQGSALFTQPPMPIKCAGAPQKAMYLSADHWLREGRLDGIEIGFYNAGAALFGVKEYVAPLMEYVKRYDAALHFQHDLVRIDGPTKRAWFARTSPDGTRDEVEVTFDMIHVTPPQRAHHFVRTSPLADAAGWVDVDRASLRHKRFPDVYGLGDACNAPNAKTAAAARKQAPVVAHNLLMDMGMTSGPEAAYDGYGSCPLTVERGKVLLAEFGYGGRLLPSFPAWLVDGTKPSRAAWLLKERMLPPIYWNAMLRGREWLARPKPVEAWPVA
jgi:sulfide:quinone oxidoreductase